MTYRLQPFDGNGEPAGTVVTLGGPVETAGADNVWIGSQAVVGRYFSIEP